MRKLFIPAFCLWHMTAVLWWTFPYGYSDMVAKSTGRDDSGGRIFKRMIPDEHDRLSVLLRTYINATGSQQYWDFFAPSSPRFHQYLSVCESVVSDPQQGTIACKGKPLFSNFAADFAAFKGFGGNDRSRLYRLTENLAKLDDPLLLDSFTRFHLIYRRGRIGNISPSEAWLVMHQFELHPELKDLPKPGYRQDRLLWVAR